VKAILAGVLFNEFGKVTGALGSEIAGHIASCFPVSVFERYAHIIIPAIQSEL
jgi:hypothetical protein